MKRLILFLISVVVLVLLVGGSGVPVTDALPGAPFNPHGNYSTKTNNCMTCHQPHKTVTSPQAACAGCHPKVQTHVQQACADCHDPHGQSTSNADFIRPVINGKQVSFNGKNFDTTGDSICRVCHTTTQFQTSSPARKTHYEQQQCTKCHPHSAGFNPAPACNACHGYPPDTGAHSRHFEKDLKLACTDCHPKVSTLVDGGHRNGYVNFKDDKGRANLGNTGVCNECHGSPPGISQAKAMWKEGGPIDCIGCHNSVQPSIINDERAPGVDLYWTKNGHGKGADQGRDLDCRACHNPDAPHLNLKTPDMRLWTDAPALCARCHADPARAGLDVSTHGNQGYSNATQKPFSEQCVNCHNPHGSPNLFAIKEVVNGNRVYFLSLTGENSFDTPNNDNTRDICATCHTTTAHNRVPSNQATNPHYEGQNCTTCHKHETDGDPKTADAFMPSGGCIECHKSAQDNGDNVPPGGRPPVTPDFSARSHHIMGELKDSQCVVCHDQSTHGDGYVDLKQPDGGANVRFIEASDADLTPICQGCHDTDGATKTYAKGGDPFNPFADGGNLHDLPWTSTHSNKGFHGAEEGPFQETCNDCHNGHGSSNLAIILTQINGNSIQFTSRTGANSFDDPNKDDHNDLCATCHIGRTSVHPGGDHRPAGDLDLRGTDCTTCHLHDANNDISTADAFMPSCSACHGQPPPPAGRPDYVLNENLTPHQIHAGSAQGQYGQPCSTCHDRLNPAYTGHVTEPASFQDVFFSGQVSAGSYDRASRTCNTVGCHSNGNPVGGTMVYQKPVWGENKHLSCAGCHGDQSSLKTGSHGTHLAPQYSDRGGNSIGCYECHAADAKNNDNNAIANTALHVNFAKDVKFDLTDIWGKVDGTTFNAGTRACANSLCHSDGAASREQPGTPKFSSPQWGNFSSGACGSCHGVTPQTLTTGAHARHFDASNQGPGITSCDACHAPFTASTHVDGKVEFKDGQTLSQTSACNECHSPDGGIDGVAEARGKWAKDTPVSCEGCHDEQPAVVKGVAAPNVAGNNSSYGFKVTGHGRVGFTCDVCHVKSADSNHFDGVANSYNAAADNFAQTRWIAAGSLNIPITAGESYQRANYSLCMMCHQEPALVGLAEGYSNALFTHSNPPPDGYPLAVNSVVTRFRNERVEGFNFGNVKANIHWDHLDMNQVNWDSDGNGSPDSKPSCFVCHDPHGVKSVAGDTVYPSMTYADIGITHGQDAIDAYGEVTKTDYKSRCTNCHPSAGIRYYRP